MGKRKVSPQDNWPIPVEVTLYWIDARVRANTLRKVTRYTRPGQVPVSCARGTLRNPGTANFESRDHAKVLAWIRAMKREGWVTAGDLKEQQEMMAVIVRAAKRNAGGGKFDPASIANKKSGKGMPGSRKPTRDYRLGISAGNGTVVGTRMGRDYGPAKG